MTDGDLYRLIYVSRSRIPLDDPDAFEDEVGAIMSSARRRNPTIRVSGALLVTDRGFAQYLEGPRSAVAELYEAISLDGRHSDLVVLDFSPIEKRVFPVWGMGRIRPAADPRLDLDDGQIGAGATGDAIEALVAAMKAHVEAGR